MTYEETPVKNSKVSRKDVAIKALDTLNTSTVLWHLTKRHKFGIVATWAVIITAVYMFPPLPDLLLSIF